MKKWQLAMAMFALGGLLLTLWVMMLDGTLLSNLPMLFWLFVALASICLFGGFALYLIFMTIKASTGRYVDGPWFTAAFLVSLVTVLDALIVTDVWIGSGIRSISIVEAFMPRGNLLNGGVIGWTFVVLFAMFVVAFVGVAVYRHTKHWYEGFNRHAQADTHNEPAAQPSAEHRVREEQKVSTRTETHRVDDD